MFYGVVTPVHICTWIGAKCLANTCRNEREFMCSTRTTNYITDLQLRWQFFMIITISLLWFIFGYKRQKSRRQREVHTIVYLIVWEVLNNIELIAAQHYVVSKLLVSYFAIHIYFQTRVWLLQQILKTRICFESVLPRANSCLNELHKCYLMKES